MTTMRGRLSAVEDEWHIKGVPPWLDPVFTFQRTWYPDQTPPSVSFNATLAKVFGILGGGLLGYYVWEKTHHKVYTALAGAGGFIGAPLLVAAYDHFSADDGAVVDVIDEEVVENTITPTDPTMVPASPEPKMPQIVARMALPKPGLVYRPPQEQLI